MPALPSSNSRLAPWLARTAAAAALAYALAGLLAMLWLTPRVPYADEWRHYARLLSQPLFAAVFAADNGHAEVLPNLIRLADLRWCGGHELLQIAIALLLAVVSALLLWRLIRRETNVALRAAGAVCLAIGMFWLGNAHALTVVDDAAHVYWVLLALALALNCAAVKRPNAVWIGACCTLATFSFGSGLATFPALALALLLRRAWYAAAQLIAIALLIATIYSQLPGAVHEPMVLQPSHVALQTTQILGAPFVYFFWPLLDPAAAAAAPAPLRAVAMSAAQAWSGQFGDIRSSVWPQAAFGIVLIAGVGLSTLRAWRRGTAATEILGLTLAWFGLLCALLIALARSVYFGDHPDQIYALRYLPWTDIAWCGWLLALLARARTARLALVMVVVLPLLALPSEIGLAKLARHVREVAEDSALAAAAGVLPADQALGETQLADLQAALPALREAHTAMFAWPDARLLTQALPPEAVRVTTQGLRVEPIANVLDETRGVRVHARIVAAVCSTHVLAVRGGNIIGLLRELDGGEWSGVARADTDGELTLYAVCPR